MGSNKKPGIVVIYMVCDSCSRKTGVEVHPQPIWTSGTAKVLRGTPPSEKQRNSPVGLVFVLKEVPVCVHCNTLLTAFGPHTEDTHEPLF